jgi:hypothetical protein
VFRKHFILKRIAHSYKGAEVLALPKHFIPHVRLPFMPYRTLDTDRIEWRDPTFFEEERMVRRALVKMHLLASDLWVLSARFHQNTDSLVAARLIVLCQRPHWSESDWKRGYRLLRKIHFRFEHAASMDCFDDYLDAWTSWICVYAFFELVEAKRQDVRHAYAHGLRHLLN